ncbi:glucose-1-phosphate thymidylyltransferase [Evansella vedderi]|uniref:Glucose-1-phosphate thymidylyltransferase n=1 Tax=Evansella vedderi TaxID=38282 RepID=A0ABT9ZPB7_9BACI|nr:nucleotidyltransferase family protein [Evansella vedderi]MDQ0253082.1 glucose-1-phosphate thymidylyltransferase [Evansella vedderi]
MKCIILAAGYGTRLYPLTKNTAKSLLTVRDRPVMEHILEKVGKVDTVDEVFIVTNDKFYKSFVQWADSFPFSKKITVINDETTTNENRLGAIADIQFVIKQAAIDDDFLVLAGDNLFQFELTSFVDYFEKRNGDCITVHEINDRETLQRSGVVKVNNEDRVISFEEKPDNPQSNLAVPPFYLYERETIPLFKEYLEEGNNPDAPGHFIPWLIGRKPVYAYKFKGLRYDIGTLESYQKVQELFQ